MAQRRSTARMTRSSSRALSGGASEPVRLKLLGGFSVSVGNRIIEKDEWRLRKAANLLKLLALSPSHRLHREQIMDLLWPDSGRKAASNSLRRTLHAARGTLDAAWGSRYLASEGESLVLHPGGELWVDVDAFEQAATMARRSREPTAYRLAITLYAGELLPGDLYEEWAATRREELRQLHLALLTELGGLYLERGEHVVAIETLRRAVAEDPTIEEAHAGLMRLYALSERGTRALAQYELLREMLRNSLNVEPSASTRRLHDEIAADRFPPREPSTPAAEEPPHAARHNLPAPRSSFVGREAELLEVKRQLAMTRLLTLTGAGGCGKTRLALEAARELVGACPDRVWFVELAPLSDGEWVAKAVAAALGVPEQPERSIGETLADFLRTKRALLILDNCEHLIDAVARLADILLNSCIHLKVLATSRESMNVEGELNWTVPSLSVPSLERPPTVEELEGYESVRLFVERARHRSPSFFLTSENTQAVARICNRLEGMPLAIELAAARVGLSVEEIATRLDHSLRLLTTGSRTASPRQRTLKGTLDWSYELLSEAERKLFCLLSVFAGGWMLGAAEAVGAEVDTEKSDVLDSLSRLVEKSLVVAEATGEGGVRYRLLEPIRQYAQEKLEESGEEEEVRRRHASFFLALAEEAESKLRGPEDVEWLERLEGEHDNLRAALSLALEREEAELGLRFGGALWMFWESHGHYSEGRRWLEGTLEIEGTASAAVRAKALYGVCQMAHLQNDTDRAEATAKEGIELCAESEIDDSFAALFRWKLGYAVRLRGDYERAKELLEESLTLSREADDKWGIADALLELGAISLYLDDHERAKECYEEGINLCRRLGYGLRLADLLNSLGDVYMLEGAFERGADLSGEAAVLYRERGYKGGLHWALNSMGWVALLQGNHERARTSYQESLTLCLELGDRLTASESLEGLSCISGAEREAEWAARLFGAAEALREEVGSEHMPEEDALREPYLAAVRSRLDEAAWETAWAEGRAMSMEQAIEYALSERKPLTSLSPEAEGSSSDEHPTLTPREKEVAVLVTHGLTNHQIASELVLSQHTVDKHVKNILKKLGLHSRERVASRLRGQ